MPITSDRTSSTVLERVGVDDEKLLAPPGLNEPSYWPREGAPEGKAGLICLVS